MTSTTIDAHDTSAGKAVVPARRPRPVATTVAAVLMLIVGTINSAGGVVFSSLAGGGWYAAVPVFAAALPLWWVAGIGTLRGSARAHRIGSAMLVALFAFGIYKICWVHESAAYPFQALSVVIASLHLSRATRRYVA